MYAYKFVRIETKKTASVKPKKNYKKIVKAHAEEGWRLIQVFAPPTSFNGAAEYFELIFEKKQRPFKGRCFFDAC